VDAFKLTNIRLHTCLLLKVLNNKTKKVNKTDILTLDILT